MAKPEAESTLRASPTGPPLLPPGNAPRESEPRVVVNVPSGNGHDSSGSIPEYLNAAAALLWPIVVLILLLSFRKEIIGLARRLQKGSFLGAEAEFGPELDQLQKEAARATQEAEAAVEMIGSAAESPTAKSNDLDALRAEVLAEAQRSPRLALMLLSAEIEKLARRVAGETGGQYKSLYASVRKWQEHLPSHAGEAFRLFAAVRNRILHGGTASDEEILRAIDSGLALAAALRSLPTSKLVVLQAGIELFTDPECKVPADGKGVMLSVKDPEGDTEIQIWPTRRDYGVGISVSPEWAFEKVWPATWYRHPDSGEVIHAWLQAAEFVGRNLDSD